MLVMNKHGAEKLLSTKFTLGGFEDRSRQSNVFLDAAW